MTMRAVHAAFAALLILQVRVRYSCPAFSHRPGIINIQIGGSTRSKLMLSFARYSQQAEAGERYENSLREAAKSDHAASSIARQ